MNVAIMIPSLAGGGAERAASVLGNYLIEKGYDVFYFLPFNDEKNEAYEVKGKKVLLRIDSYLGNAYDYSEERFIKNMYLAAKEVSKIKREYKIDVTISFMELCNYLNALSGRNGRTILSVRTVISTYKDQYSFYSKKLFKDVFSLADCIVAVSQYVKEDIIHTYGLSDDSIVVIPNAAIRQGDVKMEKEWAHGEDSIIYVGRLSIEKQVDRIIRAFSYAKKQCESANLFILGQGPQLDYLKWIAEKNGVDNCVFFKGFTSDIGYYLRNANSFVMASREEGFPNAMVEAMSYGTPIISTNSPGGCREILGSNGEISEVAFCKYGIVTPYIRGKAPSGTTLEAEEIMLGKAMIAMIKEKEIRNRYKKMSLERANDYSMNKVMDYWEKIIKMR